MWYLIESPFGRIAYTVHSNGTVTIQPHTHSAELKPYRDLVTGDTRMVPAEVPYYNTDRTPSGRTGVERPVLTINGKRYGDELGGWSATIELRTRYESDQPTPFLSTNYSEHLTPSAYEKLNEWATEHYAEMASPEHIARAAYDKARSDEYYAEKAWAEAVAAYHDAQHATANARVELNRITEKAGR